MARKGKKSRPVQPRKQDSGTIIIKIGPPKTHVEPIWRGGVHHDRSKGAQRRPKHPGHVSWDD